MQIDPVEHGAGDLALIIGGTTRRPATGQCGIAQMAAATWVHSRDELDVGGKGHVRIGARNIDLASLERLSQRIEHGTLEFRQFIEEQDAEMREADLAWLDPQPSASERCHARRMVRRAKRTGAADTPFFQRSGHGLHHADLQCFRRRKRRENAGKAASQKALARAGRPDHQEIVSACRSDFQRALCSFLPFDLLEIATGRFAFDHAGFRIGQTLSSLQMIEQTGEIGGRAHRDFARPACFRPLSPGADKSDLLLACMDGREQDARRGYDSRVERQFPYRDPVAQLFRIRDPHRGKQGQCDGKIIMRSFLRQIGRRQIDGDSLGRQGKPHARQRGANAFLAFADGLVRQPDDIELGQARRDGALHLYAARFQP